MDRETKRDQKISRTSTNKPLFHENCQKKKKNVLQRVWLKNHSCSCSPSLRVVYRERVVVFKERERERERERRRRRRKRSKERIKTNKKLFQLRLLLLLFRGRRERVGDRRWGHGGDGERGRGACGAVCHFLSPFMS